MFIWNDLSRKTSKPGVPNHFVPVSPIIKIETYIQPERFLKENIAQNCIKLESLVLLEVCNPG
jgi:hypothetical protein